jgi:hypothetical protein
MTRNDLRGRLVACSARLFVRIHDYLSIDGEIGMSDTPYRLC